MTSIRFADYGVNLVCSGIVVQKDFLKKNPDLVRRFMRAATRSMEDAAKNPEAAVDAMLKADPKSGFKESLWSRPEAGDRALPGAGHAAGPAVSGRRQDDSDSFQMLVDYGGLDKDAAGKVEDYYTNGLSALRVLRLSVRERERQGCESRKEGRDRSRD